MAGLSDFKRGQIVGACIAGTRVTKTTELFGVTRRTFLKVITTFEKEGKTSSVKQNSRKKWKLFEWDRWMLTQIVRKDHMNTAPKITAKHNNDL